MATKKKPQAKSKVAQAAEVWTAEVNETRRQRFERIGRRRMNEALSALRLLGNLSSPPYEWHTSDVDRMRRVLTEALNASLARFKKGRVKAKPHFDFVAEAERAKLQ